MSRTTTTLLAISLIALITIPVGAKDLGTFGAVYPIAEPDALYELKVKAAKVDWGKLFNRDKMTRRIRGYRPKDLLKLPAASHDRTFLVGMSYTLDRDIPDGKGGILYRKGYTFNPLDYVRFNRVLVIVDGSDRRQIQWFRWSPWHKDMNAMLLLTGGSWYKSGESLKRPVFYADKLLVSRLKLRAVPSVAVQKGQFMEVREYAVR